MVRNLAQPPETLVKLDAGGKILKTTLDNLTKVKGSKLAKMFEGIDKLPRTEEGAVFIDRDDVAFGDLIKQLRNLPKKTLLTDKDRLRDFEEELAFWNIDIDSQITI